MGSLIFGLWMMGPFIMDYVIMELWGLWYHRVIDCGIMDYGIMDYGSIGFLIMGLWIMGRWIIGLLIMVRTLWDCGL